MRPKLAEELMPLGRHADIVLRELDGELLAYDLASDRVHCLNRIAADVFRACDGRSRRKSVLRELCREHRLPEHDALLEAAIEEIERVGLLAEPLRSTRPRGERSTRRQWLKTIGIAAATLPAITSITAPTAAQASSCTGPGGTPMAGRPAVPIPSMFRA